MCAVGSGGTLGGVSRALKAVEGVLLLAVRAMLNTKLVLGPVAWLPFVLLIGVYVLGFLGLAYSLYPWVVIDRLTLWRRPNAGRSPLKATARASLR